MHLKSLELNGFKSFASKATLEFPRGITAIVGPNGSGKSNVIDAIRWLLGERDAKNLRGAKIENLIFSGTPKRPKMGMAQVGLFFDNSSGFFPVDYNEVSIVRRVSRDGISQYFLNKSEARLKDIIDFFARARLGTKGLTIINQGSSDLFVRATPEERRIMIEEVLGLREFQIKKAEAERKLASTIINLEKAKAMTEEVLPRLRMLKRQTAKWEKRQEIEDELHELENIYFSRKLQEIEAEKQKLASPAKDLDAQIIQKRNELKISETEIKNIENKLNKNNLQEIKNQKNILLEKRFKIQKELSRIETTLEILSASSVNNDFQKEELLIFIKDVKNNLEESLKINDFDAVLNSIKKILSEASALLNRPNILKSEKLNDLEKSKNNLTEEMSLAEADIKKLESEEQELTFSLEEFNKNFQKAYEAFEFKKEEIGRLENQKQKIFFEKEKLEIKFSDLKNQCHQINRKIEEFLSLQINQQINPQIDPLETERKMLKLRGELASIGEIDQAIIKEATETENHFNFLTLQSQDLEKAIEDLKNLIKELKEKIHSEFSGSLKSINDKFNDFFKLMFEGGSAKMKLKKEEFKIKETEEENAQITAEENEQEKEEKIGIDIELNLPKKRITNLEMLSGGEKSLVSIAALFALISVSPPPFLVLDEVDAPLDEKNSKRFSTLIKEFATQTQFIIVTHNRSVMEAADVLYGVTMNDDGTSKLLSLKLSETAS